MHNSSYLLLTKGQYNSK